MAPLPVTSPVRVIVWLPVKQVAQPIAPVEVLKVTGEVPENWRYKVEVVKEMTRFALKSPPPASRPPPVIVIEEEANPGFVQVSVLPENESVAE